MLARTIWPGQDPIGQVLIGDGAAPNGRRVVGVVGDVRHRALESGAGAEFYMPIRQTRDYGGLHLVVRSSRAPSTLVPALRTSMLESLYFVRKLLARRMPLLRLTYNVFIYGLLLSIVAFAVAIVLR